MGKAVDDILNGDEIPNELLNLDNSDIDISNDEQEIHPSFENAEQLRQLLVDDEPDDSDAIPILFLDWLRT
ncbi:hypothetical protein LSTR_LSTR003970 [Laodelphax striatellus]|uniref:Uncharacterized protein n=1 Tax=Laodelphax striatellus TaxID=195883 RepID=A0A482WF57_LAOST|nr:hypothetical protein LSTR_LSTR003970 [Laodelphax striatellus]